MERFENGSDMCEFRSLDNGARKRVLDLLSHETAANRTQSVQCSATDRDVVERCREEV